ncbi:hypothetical protein ELI24_39210 [Rhizobium ruizarguesonis]|uniref:hypothetical protein n=2 Tax=Rhizobium ruizarguesonis TaxID=2081791 RepID=UPI0010300C90|nr:hypothetical protein [Rhizobium ruizarguesonis]TAV82653.1 hypothetical protein ELI24_39210 [Rhizobium ruizarguesonis]
MKDDKSERRRNCADRMRKAAMERRRQRGKDPAMSVFVQLLGLMALGLRLLPDFSPSSSATIALPAPPRVPLPVPGAVPFERYKRTPSWATVAKDLARPAATEDAQRELRLRLPPSCSAWVDHIVRESAWSDVRIHVQNNDADEITAALVAEARRWESQRKADKAQALAELKAEAEGGGAASSAKPGAGTGWERKS